MKLALPDHDNAAGWRRLLMGGMAVMLVVYTFDVFVRPALMGTSDVVIHDDARQFLTWMPRLVDPAAMRGDWLADFWEDVSPPFYKAIYWLAARAGLAPLVFARVLPALLLVASAIAAWRLARAMQLAAPVAFCAASFLVALLLKEDSLFSATPRGVAVPMLLVFLEGLVRDRWRLMTSGFVLMAMTYPALAVVSWTMLALSRLELGAHFREWRLAGGWHDLWRLGLTGGAIAVLVLAFREQSDRWGPVLTFAAASDLPGLMDPGARSAIVDEFGRINYLCSMRMGFLPEIIPCGRGVPFETLGNILFFAPLLWLAWQSLVSGDAAVRRANRIYLLALIAAVIWFVIAALFTFRLHLPSRFSQRLLYPLEWLAIGQVLGQWLYSQAQKGNRGWGVRAAGVGVGAFIAGSFLSPLALLRTPEDPEIIRAIRALPSDARISGVSAVMDFVPTLAGKTVAGAPQHAIPWQTGYYWRVMTGIEDALAARSTDDPAVLRAALVRSGGTHILMARREGGLDPVPLEFEDAAPRTSTRAEAVLAARPALIEEIAPDCRVAATPLHELLLTQCVIEAIGD
ncbi:MAG: hypothetical protein ACXIT4_02140 [Erythrobacter sp.]